MWRKVVDAYEWLRERAEDAYALLHGDPDFRRKKRDPRNGL